jgi:hypothetical protein
MITQGRSDTGPTGVAWRGLGQNGHLSLDADGPGEAADKHLPEELVLLAQLVVLVRQEQHRPLQLLQSPLLALSTLLRGGHGVYQCLPSIGG